jgi:hypothetical protein
MRETGRSRNFRRGKKGPKQVGVLGVGEMTRRDRVSAEYGRENEGKGRSWEEREAEQRGRFLYTHGRRAGGDDNTTYGAAIPETAKLTGSGNSQVLALQLQRLKEAIDAGNIPACSRLRSQGCPMDQPLPGGPGIPIIAALSSKKPDVVLWLLENGGGKWGTLSDNAEEGVIQHALRYKSCNTLLERLMHHFELIWPEWITGEWSAVNAAICSGNMHGLRIVLNFIRNLSGRKRYVGSSQTGLRQADSSPWQQWKHDGGSRSA